MAIEYYSDFLSNFNKHPLSSDLGRKTNEDAVAASIRNILLTDRGEWPFQPGLGSDIRKSLFQNFGPFVIEDLSKAIKEAIKTFEPRAELKGLKIYEAISEGGIGVNILYQTINLTSPVSLTVILKRDR